MGDGVQVVRICFFGGKKRLVSKTRPPIAHLLSLSLFLPRGSVRPYSAHLLRRVGVHADEENVGHAN